MTTYLTATQAATRLGKSEKTIRRWITDGRLVAHHPHGRKNMLAIAESDIEKLEQEEAQYKRPAESEDTSSLEARIAQLEQGLSSVDYGTDYAVINSLERRLDAFEDRLAAIERLLSVGTPAQPAAAEATRTRTPRASATTAAIEPLEHLPQGSTPHYIFADKHGVHRRTFHDHIKKELVPAIVRQKPNRNEKAYWLTPEQQRAAIEYWRANDTTFHTCELCPHSDEVYQRAGQDQQSAETMM